MYAKVYTLHLSRNTESIANTIKNLENLWKSDITDKNHLFFYWGIVHANEFQGMTQISIIHTKRLAQYKLPGDSFDYAFIDKLMTAC